MAKTFTLSGLHMPPIGAQEMGLPIRKIPEKLRFPPMGGISVPLRATVVKVAFMKLAATGVLAALVAVNASSEKVAFSCALAASVNFIACVHYAFICECACALTPFAPTHRTPCESQGR
jgi:hypothetical protein